MTVHANSIDCISIKLNEKDKLALASAPRKLDDYSARVLKENPFTLPANVCRGLINEDCVKRLADGVYDLGIQNSFQFEIIRHQITPEIKMPLHFTTTFDYEGIHVAAPIYISILHRIMTSTFSLNLKESIVRTYITNYLESFQLGIDVTIMGMPSLKHNSATKRILLEMSNYRMQTIVHGDISNDLYYFSCDKHTQSAADWLLKDSWMSQINSKILEIWSENLQLARRKNWDDASELTDLQMDEAVNLLASSFSI